MADNISAFATFPILPALAPVPSLSHCRRSPPKRLPLHRLSPSAPSRLPSTSLTRTTPRAAAVETEHVQRLDTEKLTGVFSNTVSKSSPQDYPEDEYVDYDEDGHPVLVLSFVTANCRACMYAQRGFARLAREFAQLRTHRKARFYEVDVSDKRNHRLGQQLGVTAVPSFQVFAYKPEEELDIISEQPTTITSSSSSSSSNSRKGAFGVLDELVGARVVGKMRDRLLHYCSEAFDLNEYVFDEDEE